MLSATAPARLRAAYRRTKVVQLRLAGRTLADIGRELGCSPQRVHAILTREMQSAQGLRKETAEELLQLELQRLDVLQAAVWDKALAGDLKAVETALRVIDRRVRLRGLDAPTRSQITVGGYAADLSKLTDAELIEQARRLGLEVPDELEAQTQPTPPAGE
jgi:hypothetical protein